MQKPVTVIRAELTENIINLIKESKLPAFAVMDIIGDLYNQLIQENQRQIREDTAAWEAYLGDKTETDISGETD